MAIYQLTVEIIPATYTDAAALFHDQGYSVAPAWAHSPRCAEQLAKQIDAVMPRAASWFAEMVSWGDDKVNDLRLWQVENGDGVGSLTARIDCVEPMLAFFEGLARIAAMAGLSALLPDTRQVLSNPTADALRCTAERSRPALIVATPLGGTH